MHYVPRRLSWPDKDGKRVFVQEAALPDEPLPLVVLGDPGMGKSELLRRLGRRGGYVYMTAAQFLRRPPGGLPEGILLLDALDEVSAGRDTDPLERVLERLGEAGWPEFILSCRAADWVGNARAKAIADDYGQAARILTLEPLDEQESAALLEARLGPSGSRAFLQALRSHRLAGLLTNPQSLLMLIEVADDGIPIGRADLFDRAARKMIAEHNEGHVQSALNRLDPDDVLDGAGAAMAMLLLGGREGLFAGLQAQTPAPLEHIARIAALPLAEHSPIALRSRLFRTTGEPDSFKDCHRTVAEYLGARWLGRVADGSGNPRRLVGRLLALMQAGGRVPASLRGLHAWLAHASTHFAKPVIEADPYGVLRYGDLGTVTAETAVHVWDSFERHGRDDPWFRAGDWQRFTVAGLVQRGLGDRLAGLLNDPRSSFHLRSLVLELLRGGACVPEMKDDLLALVSDSERSYSERLDAVAVLGAWRDSGIDWPELFARISAKGDLDAPRLADESFAVIGIDRFTDAQIGDIVLASYSGFADAAARRRYSRSDDFWSLADAVPLERCAGLLDAVALRFAPGTRGATLAEQDCELGHLVSTLIARQIPSGNPDPIRLWRWLDASAAFHDWRRGPLTAVSAWLEGNRALRQAIHSQIFFTEEGAASRRRRHWRLGDLSPGLQLQDEDVLELLARLVREDRRDPDARELFAIIVNGFPLHSEWTPLMEAYAAGDPALCAILHPPAVPENADIRRRSDRFAAEQRRAGRKREARHRADREAVLRERDALREGRGPAASLALCYLGHRKFGSHSRLPEERIGAWVGGDLHADALAGFEASLHRPVDGSLHDIAARGVDRYDEGDPIWPVVAGLAQRYREGRGFDGIGEDHLLAGLIVKRFALTVVDKHREGFGEALESFALADAGRFESFLRAMIEPQLGSGRHYIVGMHYVLGGKEHRDLRARLLLEWFDDFAGGVATDCEVLAQALLDVPQPMRDEAGRCLDRLIAEAPPRPDGEDRTPNWTALRLLRDFDAGREALEGAARSPDFLWSIQKAIGHAGFTNGRIRPLPAERLAWIFQRCAEHWPGTERPQGITSGSRNPWDASEFLVAVLFRLAEDTTPEAMRLLHALTERSDGGYDESLRAARSRQRRKAAEQDYVPHSVATVAAAIREAAPTTPADVKAIALDAIAQLQAQIAGSATDTVDLFYDGKRPKDEARCRNALIDLLGPMLPHNIVSAPEEQMPCGKRADAGFRLGGMRVPLEAKLAWNPGLWTACSDQLDRLYASADHLADGQGIYLVFWFGSSQETGRPLPRPPRGERPGSPDELEKMLGAQLLAGAGGRLSICVLDLSRRRT